MTLKKLDKFHSNGELVLAIVNNWCAKHNEKPELCGATKEVRELAGDVLKLSGSLLLIAALVKTISK